MADTQFRCEICKLNTGSEANYQSHIGGIKHRKKQNNLAAHLNRTKELKTEGYNSKRSLPNDTPVENSNVSKNIDSNIIKVKNIVSSSAPFSIIMDNLMKEIQLPLHIMNEKYNRVCRNLEVVLSRKFRECQAYPFGSTVTGLGFKTSDLDVYIDIKKHMLPINMSDKTASDFTKISKSLLYKTNLFTDIIAIPHAKTPIVKCVHVATGVKCDFNFKNMLGVCNSKLIRFLLSSHKGVFGAMLIIKYWARLHEISGTGKFTNYTLSMMFIFYLQVNRYLPSVYSLQLSKEHVFMQDGWNAGFCADGNLLPPINIPFDVVIPQLLLGFFQFYSNFDYGVYVISPSVGKPILKCKFESYSTDLSRALQMLSAICVQDPFVHVHNITSYISLKQLQEFQFLCEGSSKAIEAVKDTPNKLFYNLFFTVQKPKVNNIEISNNEMCTFKIPYTLTVLPTHPVTDTGELSKIWFDDLLQFLLSVLTKVYLFNIIARKEYRPKKYMKINGKKDVHDNDIVETFGFHCTANLITWEGRKNLIKSFQATNKTEHLTNLEKEIAVSEYLLKLCAKQDLTAAIVDFDFTYTTKMNPIEATFSLHNIKSDKNHFKTMSRNLAFSIPFLFQKHLKESSVQSDVTENIKTESSNAEKLLASIGKVLHKT